MEKKKKFGCSMDPVISSMKAGNVVIELWGRTRAFCMIREPSNGGKPRAIILYREKEDELF